MPREQEINRLIDYRYGPTAEEREAARAQQKELRRSLAREHRRAALVAAAGVGLTLLMVCISELGMVDIVKAYGR